VNGPQEGPGDREEAWSANLEKMGNMSLQKGELLKLLCMSVWRRLASQCQGSLQ